jgi:hypothetical protein
MYLVVFYVGEYVWVWVGGGGGGGGGGPPPGCGWVYKIEKFRTLSAAFE